MLLGLVSLSACQKNDIVTQPKTTQNSTVVAAHPTFNAESFSTQGLTLVEGKDYKRVSNPQPVAVAGKSEVAEFFWYGCGHCYAIEPAVEAWKKTLPANVRFVRYHAQWNAAMQTQQRMAMTVQALGKSDELDLKIFNAIQDQGKSLSSDDAVSAFMVQNGVDKAAWDAAYKGFDVNASIVTADALFKAYNLDGVPKFIVNGKYVVSGDSVQTLKVINKLLEQK
jgi:thiol:disulfide interchange protein DsbA